MDNRCDYDYQYLYFEQADFNFHFFAYFHFVWKCDKVNDDLEVKPTPTKILYS